MWWNGIIAFLLVYTFSIMPLLIAFEELTQDNPWYWVEISVDLFFVADIVIILNSAYYNRNFKLIT
jgi:hypothetical protein